MVRFIQGCSLLGFLGAGVQGAPFQQTAVKATIDADGITGSVTVQDHPPTATGNADDIPSARSTLLVDVNVGNGLSAECYAGGMSYHIHDTWKNVGSTSGSGASACGGEVTSGHYDPGIACSAASANPYCWGNGAWDDDGVAWYNASWAGGCVNGSTAAFGAHGGSYVCNYENPYSCEVGDISGRHGKLEIDSASKTGTATLGDDFMVAASLLVDRSVVFHCADGTRAFCAKFESETPGTIEEEAAFCNIPDPNAPESKAMLKSVKSCLDDNALGTSGLTMCAATAGLCEPDAGLAALRDCDDALVDDVDSSMAEIFNYMCEAFIATFDQGATGTVVVSPGGVTLNLDFSGADFAALGKPECADGGLQYHMHGGWEHAGEAKSHFGVNEEQCGVSKTGKHYDPTIACSLESDNPKCNTAHNTVGQTFGYQPEATPTPTGTEEGGGAEGSDGGDAPPTAKVPYREFDFAPCVAGSSVANPITADQVDSTTGAGDGADTYACNKATYQENPFNCEVGDLSGKHGLLDIPPDGKVSLSYSDPWLPPASVFKQNIVGKSITFHCNDGTRVMCAQLVTPPNTITESPTKTPTAPATPTPTQEENNNDNIAVIVGGVCGGLVGIALIGLGILACQVQKAEAGAPADGVPETAATTEGEMHNKL